VRAEPFPALTSIKPGVVSRISHPSVRDVGSRIIRASGEARALARVITMFTHYGRSEYTTETGNYNNRSVRLRRQPHCRRATSRVPRSCNSADQASFRGPKAARMRSSAARARLLLAGISEDSLSAECPGEGNRSACPLHRHRRPERKP